MNKIKITEVASEAAKSPKDVFDACKELGFEVKSQQGSITTEQADALFKYLTEGIKPEPQPKPHKKPAQKPTEKSEKSAQNDAAKNAKKEKPAQNSEKSAKKPIEPAAAPKHEPQRTQPQPPKPQNTIQNTATVVVTAQPVPPTIAPHTPTPIAPPSVKPLPIEIARKTSGLTIISKKRAQVPPPQKQFSSSEVVHGYGRHKVALDTADEERRPRREKKIKPTTPDKKEQGKKIEILRDRELGSFDHFEENMVLMPNLSIGVSDFLDEQERNQRNARRDYEKAKTLTGATNRIVGGDGISRSKRKKRRVQTRSETQSETVRAIEIAEDVRVYEFAEKINQPIAAVIKKLFELGMMVTKNDFLGKDAIEVLAEEFGVSISTKDESQEMDYVADYDAHHTAERKTSPRPPIVTIMGHVDHGKTSLLDYIRSSRVASGEAGGITQHIGAYTVKKSGKAVTFIDTPGHEAFSSMRARGANATDIVIIVVAADDGVMPQTKEAIAHAKAAKCPIIVAINKIDKPAANLDKVKAELADANLTPLEWGGDTECVGVSAKTGAGIEHLLETILLQAELMELTAENDAYAKAIVIESALEKGRGPVATVIVQNGTLKVGDYVVAGVSFGRIRAITDDHGSHAKRLLPSEAGEIVGLDEVPSSGDTMVAMEDAEHAKAVAAKRAEYERLRALSRSTKATLDELHELIAEGRLKRLPIILKADAHGALEAISSSLTKLRNAEVKAEIIHAGVGAISESDVALAAASEHSVIFGFHIKPSQIIKDKAKSMGVTIASYDVIYDLIDDARKILGGMLSPITEERISGKAEVRQVFDIPKLGRIAGCMVMDGEITKGAIARVMRGEDEVFKGRIATLKRFKDDVKEVKKGLECGIGLGDEAVVEAGDTIVVYKAFEVEPVFAENA
ncbi:translation initiation factor IF-2 [Campylobacterota bacterium]|nr:translation initiation factor IF-2 [Campylobacterota bacterium]